MKNYAKYLLVVALACLAVSCVISAIATLVVLLTFRGTGPGEPFAIYERVHLPILSVTLPVLGMLLLAASWRVFLDEHRADLHFRDLLVKPANPHEATSEPLHKAA